MLTLYRGDDYAGQLGKTLTIHLSLDAGLPIEGLKAVFEFYDIKKEFTPIQYENDFIIEVSHNQSKKYPLGVSYGKLYCVDSAGKIRTFCNRIPICVTTNLNKVYGSDGLDKQDVHVYALVHWDNIAGKPDYFPTTIEEVEGLGEALKKAGKVKTVNNEEPDSDGNIQLNAGNIGYGKDSTIGKEIANINSELGNKLSPDDVVPKQTEGTEIAVIGGKSIKAPQGGGSITLDDTVSEASENGVKSKGIWSFVKGLFSKLSAVATSGSYNDLKDKPEIPEGADVLTLNGQRVFKNGTEEITTYSALLALVKTGGVVLLDTVAGTIAKEALFHPHMADETAIRFDATGTLGEKVYTRSFAFTPKTDGGIAVSRGDLIEVAKKTDIPTSMPWDSVTDKPTVFPPESHSHTQSEVAGLEAALEGKQKKKIVFSVAIRSQDILYLVDEDGNAISKNKYLELTENKTADTTIDFLGTRQFNHIEGDVFRSSYSFENGKFSYQELNVDAEWGEIVAILRQNVKDIEIDFASFAKSTDLADKLTDDDLKTLCTTCGISPEKPDGTPKTRAELLIDLFGESNSQLAKTIEDKAVIFLETDGTVINRGIERIKKFADLLVLVQTGRVVLKSTATTSLNSSPVLFRPQLMNSDTILFDATGDISGIMRTRNIKVTKEAVETEEGVDIKVTNGNLQTLIRESDLNARLPYALVSPTDNTIRNRSVNAFTMEGKFSPAFPSPTPGFARDFLINLTVTTAGSFELPLGISSKGDDLSFESGKKYLIAMTEYEERKFLIKLLDVTEA